MFARWRAAMVVTAALAATPAHADTVADFYKGKQVNLIVGYGPGGGYDTYARLLARHFGRFIPGNPNVIVQNMPGAGSLRAVNYLYNVAPKDGATIGTFARNMPLIGLLGGNSNVQFNPRRFTWLGSTSSFVHDAYILIVRKDAPVKSIDEARRPDLPALVLGGTAEGATGNDVPVILRDTIGLHVKQVVGYPDSASIFLAIERGEVHGRTVDLSTLRSVKPELLKPDGGSVCARNPASGFSGRADRARACQERGGACADRAGGAALCDVSTLRRAAGPAAGSRQGAAGRVPRDAR